MYLLFPQLKCPSPRSVQSSLSPHSSFCPKAAFSESPSLTPLPETAPLVLPSHPFPLFCFISQPYLPPSKSCCFCACVPVYWLPEGKAPLPVLVSKVSQSLERARYEKACSEYLWDEYMAVKGGICPRLSDTWKKEIFCSKCQSKGTGFTFFQKWDFQ